MKRFGLIGAALLVLGACDTSTNSAVTAQGAASNVAFTVPVTDSFSQATFRVTGGAAPAYTARWQVALRGDRAYLCGAGTRDAGLLGVAVPTALRASTLEINGALVMSDVRFFADTPVGTPLLQAEANCKDIGTAPLSSFNAVLTLGG